MINSRERSCNRPFSLFSTGLGLGDYNAQRRHVRYVIVARGNWVLSLPASRVMFAVAREYVCGRGILCGAVNTASLPRDALKCRP